MNIDFHIELIKVLNEPEEARWDYLKNLRKEAKLSKIGFIVKLKEAKSNISSAYKRFEMKSLMRLPETSDLSFPFFHFLNEPYLKDFSRAFGGHVDYNLINSLERLITNYESFLLDKKQKDTRSDELKNNFNSIPIEAIRDHFSPLIERKKSNDKIWMTKEDFEIFLKRSFGLQIELSKPKINVGSKGKFALVKLFHDFYSKTLEHPYNGPRKTEKVFNLLKDAFDTPIFDDLRKDNFKSSKSKHDWN